MLGLIGISAAQIVSKLGAWLGAIDLTSASSVNLPTNTTIADEAITGIWNPGQGKLLGWVVPSSTGGTTLQIGGGAVGQGFNSLTATGGAIAQGNDTGRPWVSVASSETLNGYAGLYHNSWFPPLNVDGNQENTEIVEIKTNGGRGYIGQTSSVSFPANAIVAINLLTTTFLGFYWDTVVDSKVWFASNNSSNNHAVTDTGVTIEDILNVRIRFKWRPSITSVSWYIVRDSDGVTLASGTHGTNLPTGNCGHTVSVGKPATAASGVTVRWFGLRWEMV